MERRQLTPGVIVPFAQNHLCN